ncbi:MAG: hypothetical protein LBL34_02895 [Clostridiales bacterium]|nr:hypothetical protein [Clostridiales bacterium]
MYLLPGSPTPVWEDSSEWKEYWAEGWDGYYRQVLVDISGTAVPLYLMWPNGSASYVYAGSISNFLMPTFVVQEYTNGAISSSTFSGLTRVVSSTTLSNPGQYVQPTAQPPSAQPPSAQPPSTEPSKIDVSSSVPTVDISAPDTGEYIKVTAPYSAPGETKRYRVSVGSSNYNNSSLLESTTDASVYYYVPSTARGERLYFWVDYDYSTSYTGHTSYVRTGYVFGYISGTTSNVSGSTACGSRLSSSGLPSGTSSYQWQRSANGVSGWSNVSGATNYYYDTQAADTSYFFRVEYGADTSNYYYGSIT